MVGLWEWAAQIASAITTLATAVAAIATVATALYLRNDRRDRRDAELPLLIRFGWQVGDPRLVSVLAINPAEERWIIRSVTCHNPGIEIARSDPSGKTDEYGNPERNFGPRGHSAEIDRAIAARSIQRHGQQIIVELAVYGSGDVPYALELSALVENVPRRKFSKRFTATINITD